MNAMMIKVALILFAVVVVATATPFLQLGDDDVLGDVDVEISVRGGHKTLTYKTPNGNVIDVTHVLKSEDVIVNIPGQNEVCNVRQLQQTINDVEGSLTCTERIAMTDEELSPKLAEICRGKAVFAEKYAPCKLVSPEQVSPKQVSPEFVEIMSANQFAGCVLQVYAVKSAVQGRAACVEVWESLTCSKT
ncbi:hypothetical protein MAR_031649 [Mya arenaria]|uniref:Uncharacterized protein n=1 Tax=Mya arenaria TaxID=6604 RepID=A0ABY7F4I3_MYAAR|nr:hypothetical protein MAR_031649 [Mya arenaria]